jgi:hydroxymethylglutaryl-CoA reductase
MKHRYDVEPTVEAIRSMAEQLRQKAAKLDELATEMVATGNLSLAANAANVVTSSVSHMDYLVNRPLAAMANPKGC